MNKELSRKSVFQDVLFRIEQDGVENPFEMSDISELSDIFINKNIANQIFFYGDKLIFSRKGKIYSTQKISKKIKVVEALTILFYIFKDIVDIKDKKKFANKLFYYIDTPVDPFTLKEWGVDLDISAVNIDSFIDI